jgi:uncharacterized protein DUF2380
MRILENVRNPTRCLGCGQRLGRAAALLAVALLLAVWAVPAGQALAKPAKQIAVLPFEIHDNSGEVGANQHDEMLVRLTSFIAKKIDEAGVFDVVDQGRVDKAVAAEDSGTYLRACNGCELDIAKSAGADYVMIGWLFKMSTLVMSLHVVVKDATTGGIVYAKTFDFRGDNEKSWTRAADYMVGALSRSQATN